MSILDIDPNNIRFEFGREWGQFRESRAHAVLVLLCKMLIETGRTRLEKVETIYDCAYNQGSISTARSLLMILDKPDIADKVAEILEFVKQYGK